MVRGLLRLVAVAVLGVVFAFGSISPAAAQTAPDPDDFTDPVTGEFDFDAYLAALNASANQSGGPAGTALPRTGSSSTDVVVLGLTLIVVGGVVTASSRWQASRARSSATV